MQRITRLRSDLVAFRPRTDDQRGFHERMLRLAERGEEAFSRATFSPGHFTASAFVLSPDESELLLILHAKLGLWLQPGGHVDADDASLLDAARREAAEEAGVADLELASDGIFDVDVHPIPSRGAEPAHEHFDVRFLFRAHTREVRAATDAKAARWSPLDRIDGSDRSVYRAVELLRAP